MKIIMIAFLAGFLVFGGIGLVIRLSHDWNKLEVETDKLSEHSTAKVDGRAMQIIEHKHEIDAAEVQKRVNRKFQMQMVFSALSVLCLVAACVCGAVMQR